MTKSYPWYTPYQFAGNKPIWAIDLDGLEEYIYVYKWYQNQETCEFEIQASPTMILSVHSNSEVYNDYVKQYGNENLTTGTLVVNEYYNSDGTVSTDSKFVDHSLLSDGGINHNALSGVSKLSEKGTAVDAVISSTVTLNSLTKGALNTSSSSIYKFADVVTDVTAYMNSADYAAQGVQFADGVMVTSVENLHNAKLAGFIDVTESVSTTANGIRVLQRVSGGLTYLGIAVDGVLFADLLSDDTIPNAQKLDDGVFFGLKAAASLYSTTNIAGALFYFEIVAGEAFINTSLEYTEKQNRGEIEFDDVTCFVEGTLITMGDYSLKKIEDLKEGDIVLSYNLPLGKEDTFKIKTVASPLHRNIYKIIFSNGVNNMNTIDHPYWVVNKGWCSLAPDLTRQNYSIDTKQLGKGDICLVFVDGEVKQIVVNEFIPINGVFQTYNISGGNNKPYFANGILVSDENQ